MSPFLLHPRLAADTAPIGDFPLCRVLLMNESRYPWIILVPRIDGLREPFDLAPDDRLRLFEESLFVAQKLNLHFHADKMNTAILGNIVEQLHVHHIVRYKTDPAWPAPVWGRFEPLPYSEAELIPLTESLKALFKERIRGEEGSIV